MFFRKMQVDEKLLHHACVAFGKSGLSDSRFSRNYENIQKQIAFDKTLFFRLNYDALGRWIRNYFVLENQISVIEETKDKGVIFCGYHFGSFETLPIVFGNIGIEVCSPVAYKDEYFEQHVKRIEVVKGRVFPVVPRLYSRSEKDGLILYRALREGKSILLFCDTHILLTENYLTVQLMGRSIKVNRGAAALHKKTHVPIVPVLTYQKRNQCHIRFLSPITYKQEITEHEITQRLFRILEDHVRDYPSQWAKWHDWENMVTQLG
jgi:lauroyl/myristoyl acyltransferase